MGAICPVESVTILLACAWVMKATLRATPRKVNDCLMAAAPASAAVIPGTTSVGTPAASRARNSSSARPNSMGSPPFKRTTIS